MPGVNVGALPSASDCTLCARTAGTTGTSVRPTVTAKPLEPPAVTASAGGKWGHPWHLCEELVGAGNANNTMHVSHAPGGLCSATEWTTPCAMSGPRGARGWWAPVWGDTVSPHSSPGSIPPGPRRRVGTPSNPQILLAKIAPATARPLSTVGCPPLVPGALSGLAPNTIPPPINSGQILRSTAASVLHAGRPALGAGVQLGQTPLVGGRPVRHPFRSVNVVDRARTGGRLWRRSGRRSTRSRPGVKRVTYSQVIPRTNNVPQGLQRAVVR